MAGRTLGASRSRAICGELPPKLAFFPKNAGKGLWQLGKPAPVFSQSAGKGDGVWNLYPFSLSSVGCEQIPLGLGVVELTAIGHGTSPLNILQQCRGRTPGTRLACIALKFRVHLLCHILTGSVGLIYQKLQTNAFLCRSFVQSF